MPEHVLFVCTANRNRSPMAAGLLLAALAGTPSEPDILSAGLLPAGEPPLPETVAAMAGLGVDVSAHVSRELDTDLLAWADLVIGMERQHVREAAVRSGGEALSRSFTLREVLRRGRLTGARPRGVPLATWVHGLQAERQTHELLAASTEDDVADPVGRPYEAFAETARVIRDLVDELARLGWP